MKSKTEKFIKSLKDVTFETKKELIKIKNNDSIWTKDLIEEVILPEITKLLDCAQKGELYFEYGKKQRRLQSTYFVLENTVFQEDSLARKILDLQSIDNEL